VHDHGGVYPGPPSIGPLAAQDAALRAAAARLLVDEFREHWPDAWPTLADAEREVELALAPEKVALAALGADGALLGWIGALPMYDGAVWELHPLVVARSAHGRGVGRALVAALEAELHGRGALTLWLGTDDEAGLTSLGGIDLFPDPIGRLASVESSPAHPLGFYRAVGFSVAGVVPDANGRGKPDILMAKRIQPPGAA
jgi:aminoglycoside 6'-N-acetyltransferase I